MTQDRSDSFPGGSGQELRHSQTLAPDPKIIEWRNIALLITLGLYLVLNYGFMLIRVPPSRDGGVPIGEIVLILSLLTISYHTEFSRLRLGISLAPLLVWWVYGYTRAVIGFFEHGMWALRDAVYVIESLFLLVGFAFAGSPKYRALFFRWLILVLCIGTIYSLSVPFYREIGDWSPKIINAVGVEQPLFGHYGTGYIVMTAFSASLLLRYNERPLYVIIVLLILVFVLVGFQQRTAYGIVAVTLVFLGVYRRKLLKIPLLMAATVVAIVGAISALGLEVRGYKGATIDLNFMYDLAVASFGVASGDSSEVVWSAAGGMVQRYGWWTGVFEQLMASPLNLLFGLGYGIPLTDTPYHTSVLREPHNSYISLLGRLGVVGFVIWCWLHVYLLSAWNKAYRWARKMGLHGLQTCLLVVMVYFIGVWLTAIGEDAFEKPFNIIPYYFLWGVVLRFTTAAERDHARRSRRRRSRWSRRRGHRESLPDDAAPMPASSLESLTRDRNSFGLAVLEDGRGDAR